MEEIINDINVNGVIRYRYDSSSYNDVPERYGFRDKRGLINSRQNHRFLANLSLSARMFDDFTPFLQLRYGNTREGGFGREAITTQGINLRQLGLQYTHSDSKTSIVAGKQQMDTIWTENYDDGLVGIGTKIVNTYYDGVTLQAFIYDGFNISENDQGGVGNEIGTYSTNYNSGNPYATNAVLPIYNQNLYGVSALGNFKILGGTLKPELWLSYMAESGFFYALGIAYSASVGEVGFNVDFTYLGNLLDTRLKNEINATNGNLVGLKGAMKFFGADIYLGGMYFGNKDKYSINVLEDCGNIYGVIGGQEYIYTDGSHLTGDRGSNAFVFGGLGYSISGFRIGGDIAYGETKTGIENLGGNKLEYVARASYKFSKNLNFLLWYSHIDIKAEISKIMSRKNTVRFQALYRF